MGLFSGIVSTVGGLFGAKKSADRAASSAREQQERSIEWQREAAQHSHQWEVEDLKKAGLNPMLSANGGATVPGATTASATANPDYSGAISKGVSTALAFENLKLQKEQMKINKQNADAATTTADANALHAQNETERNASAIELNQASSKEKYQMVEQSQFLIMNEDRKFTLEKTMREAGLSIEQQKLVLATFATYSNAAIGNKMADAALMGASAQQRNASTNEFAAHTARMVGVSQADVNYANSAKGRAETKHALQKVEAYAHDHPAATGARRNGVTEALAAFREEFDYVNPLSNMFTFGR